jgi:hypothetical protein
MNKWSYQFVVVVRKLGGVAPRQEDELTERVNVDEEGDLVSVRRQVVGHSLGLRLGERARPVVEIGARV